MFIESGLHPENSMFIESGLLKNGCKHFVCLVLIRSKNRKASTPNSNQK